MAGERNWWCEVLGIEVPSLKATVGHREGGTTSYMLTALLEHGGPMTLDDIAARFEEAGIAAKDAALRSLRKSRPTKSPFQRSGKLFYLDPFDAEADLWTFRVGLRGPQPDPEGSRKQTLTKKLDSEPRALLFGGLSRAGGEPVALLDARTRSIEIVEASELAAALERFRWIGAFDTHSLLREIGFDAEDRRVVQFDPPQAKCEGITLSPEQMVKDSCRIRAPFARPDQKMSSSKRLERGAQSLWAFYRYTHATRNVLVRIGTKYAVELFVFYVDANDPMTLTWLNRESERTGRPVEAVLNKAPPWSTPWKGAKLFRGADYRLWDGAGREVEAWRVQAARLR